MKIYLVWKTHRFNGDNLKGLFKEQDKAEAFRDKLQNENTDPFVMFYMTKNEVE